MIEIDGSIGEGGGQVLRSSLTLSILTGGSFRIFNIRANREKAGLSHQHLVSVKAAAKICQASVTGNHLGSSEITFQPKNVRGGRYKFDIQTAGSTSLVLQTIFLPLSICGSTTSILLTGGTHVRWAPCYHYLEYQWIPFLNSMGFKASVELIKAGYYPEGNGKISAIVRPVGDITPIQLLKRGNLVEINGISAVSNLDKSIAFRQTAQAHRRLAKYTSTTNIKNIHLPSQHKGTLLLIAAQFEYSQCCYFSLGELGKPAEKVADEAVDQFEAFITTDGTIDQYLADQLILPMCFAKGTSQMRTNKITNHLLTNVAIVQEFLNRKITIEGDIGKPGTILVAG